MLHKVLHYFWCDSDWVATSQTKLQWSSKTFKAMFMWQWENVNKYKRGKIVLVALKKCCVKSIENSLGKRILSILWFHPSVFEKR